MIGRIWARSPCETKLLLPYPRRMYYDNLIGTSKQRPINKSWLIQPMACCLTLKDWKSLSDMSDVKGIKKWHKHSAPKINCAITIIFQLTRTRNKILNCLKIENLFLWGWNCLYLFWPQPEWTSFCRVTWSGG